jgi:hypothetical protein
MRQVVLVAGGRGDVCHVPVDANSPPGRGERFNLGLDDEAGIPVADGVPVDAYRTRLRRQRARPHDRHDDAAGKLQLAVVHAKAVLGIAQRRTGNALLLKARKPGLPSPRHLVLDVLQGLCPGPAEVADSLLLDNRPARPKPFVLGPPAGQHLVELSRTAGLPVRRSFPLIPLMSLFRDLDALVPHPPAQAVFSNQPALG